MGTASASTAPFTFEPPGPGTWMLDATHHGRRPVTRFMAPIQAAALEQGMPQIFAAYGLPLAEARTGTVNGCSYIRIMGIGEPEDPKGGPPPAFILRIVARVHPEMRRRNRAAAAALRDRRWRDDVDRWFDTDRPEVVATNRRFQEVDLGGLDDEGLVAHLVEVTSHLRRCAVEGFAHHGGDLVPIGLYLAACSAWGIDPADAVSLLRGASPATVESQRLLAPVAAAIAAAPVPPASITDVRALGSDVAERVDEWLGDHGWRLLTSDDIDAPTLAERPDLALRALLAARADHAEIEAPDPSDLRSRVPATDRDRFDERLAEARYGMRLRDDHVGVRWNWAAGLVRRALLEVGARLEARGGADEVDHALELEEAEVAASLAGDGPTAEELAARRTFRDAVEAAGPPARLGPPDAGPPPFDLFPTPLATMAAGVFASISAMEPDDGREPMHGTGIGDETVTGRACVVRSAIDAFDRLEPGDILVVPFTSPSYDPLYPLVGAVVTDEGGPMSHAAIMAREYGVSAVIGAATATTTVPDGALVEVDPARGKVRVLD